MDAQLNISMTAKRFTQPDIHRGERIRKTSLGETPQRKELRAFVIASLSASGTAKRLTRSHVQMDREPDLQLQRENRFERRTWRFWRGHTAMSLGLLGNQCIRICRSARNLVSILKEWPLPKERTWQVESVWQCLSPDEDLLRATGRQEVSSLELSCIWKCPVHVRVFLEVRPETQALL